MATQINSTNVLEAHRRIAKFIVNTPCVFEPVLSEKLDAQIYLKLDNFQRTGSFKERGALNRLLMLTDSEKLNGVVTASAGNHAQAVAYHANKLGIKSTIFMPFHTPSIKATHTEEFGATVRFVGENYDEAHEAALKFSLESGTFYLHAYNDSSVIAGQGTIALEILRQVPEVDIILVPVGGGGLISGIALALEDYSIRIIGVEARNTTLADGIRVKKIGVLTDSICKRLVSDWFLVKDNSIADAMLHLLGESKIVSEGAGAAALVPILENRISDIKGKTVCVVISGGNIDIKLQHIAGGHGARLMLALSELYV